MAEMIGLWFVGGLVLGCILTMMAVDWPKRKEIERLKERVRAAHDSKREAWDRWESDRDAFRSKEDYARGYTECKTGYEKSEREQTEEAWKKVRLQEAISADLREEVKGARTTLGSENSESLGDVARRVMARLLFLSTGEKKAKK